EDVRRARADWEPRALARAEQDLLWQRLAGVGRLLARHSPVGVALRRSDTGEMITAKAGTPAVTLVGEPLELVMRLYGRQACIIDVEGAADAIAAFETGRFGL
ncbi:MAG: TIGR03085 family protein, partial [Candidatus Nanopelagicales bacterium]